MIKFAIFDLDEVLYFYDQKARISQFAQIANLSSEEIRKIWLESGWEDKSEIGFFKNGIEYLNGFNALLKIDLTIDQWCQIRKKFMRPNYAALDFAKSLKNKGIKIAILTNNGPLLGENYQTITPLLNEIFGDNFHCASNFKARKPDKECFEAILKTYNYQPSETLFIDDNKDNIKGAKTLGIVTILYKQSIDLFKEFSQLDKKLTIKEDDLSGAEIRHLLNAHFTLMRSNSPPESCHVLPIDDLKTPDIKFWSAWENNQLIGCGALKDLGDGHGEIKSMHVYQNQRGKGFSSQILKYILDYAKNNNFKRLSLETGSFDLFIPARALYASHGFAECAPFGDYVLDPNSTFMTKTID